ncbi:arogenate dehydratase 1-like [Magnolia sinica]|uniref:arogenate dehydratase 1-like n=1 Tax=Magnolia sinica TaxID=86752 RepID=UPI0026585D0B|nr:arogenate dehydratase 1-like [Magnolia sinica]
MAFASPLEFTTQLSSTAKRSNLPVLLPQSVGPTKPVRRSVSAYTSQNGAVPRRPVQRLRVAYQGVPGAYSEFAAKTACPDCTAVPCKAFIDAITAVEAGYADRAIVPVESTLEGTTVRNYDLLLHHDLRIVQEINLFVHYCLLAMPGVRKGELKKVISHPVALAHCGRNLNQLGLNGEAVDDTAGAVELLLSNRMLDTAAIASSRAALLYGLNVLAHGFQDESWNVTRFLILSKDPVVARLSLFGLKTSMVIAHSGMMLTVLLGVLSAFSSRNINLTKLEMNPSSEVDGPISILDVQGGGSIKEFPHVVFVDFEGSVDEQKVKDAIDEISKLSVFVRILGCYSADPNIYDLH